MAIGRPMAPLILDDVERETLVRWVRRPKTSQALALRARSAPVRPVSGAGSGALAPSGWAGTMGYCRAIWGCLNSSYNDHCRNGCPGPGNGQMSVKTVLSHGRFALQGLARSSRYYQPREVPGGNLALMEGMDRQYLDTPFYGPSSSTAPDQPVDPPPPATSAPAFYTLRLSRILSSLFGLPGHPIPVTFTVGALDRFYPNPQEVCFEPKGRPGQPCQPDELQQRRLLGVPGFRRPARRLGGPDRRE